LPEPLRNPKQMFNEIYHNERFSPQNLISDNINRKPYINKDEDKTVSSNFKISSNNDYKYFQNDRENQDLLNNNYSNQLNKEKNHFNQIQHDYFERNSEKEIELENYKNEKIGDYYDRKEDFQPKDRFKFQMENRNKIEENEKAFNNGNLVKHYSHEMNSKVPPKDLNDYHRNQYNSPSNLSELNKNIINNQNNIYHERVFILLI